MTAYGGYRWRDVAGYYYSEWYRNNYSYNNSDVEVEITFDDNSTTFHGQLNATHLKPNFACQLKLAGYPEVPGQSEVEKICNEKIGLVSRWWQETWNGSEWASGQNLNNKGDGSSPNPNDNTYFDRKDIEDPTSPTGKKYRYTGYLLFDYFITDENGSAYLEIVIWSPIGMLLPRGIFHIHQERCSIIFQYKPTILILPALQKMWSGPLEGLSCRQGNQVFL